MVRRNIWIGENCKRYVVCLYIGLLYNKKKLILWSIVIDFCVRFWYFFFCRNKIRLCNIYCMFVCDVWFMCIGNEMYLNNIYVK